MHFIWPPRAGCTSSRQSLDLNALSSRLRGPKRDSWARAAGANELRGKGKGVRGMKSRRRVNSATGSLTTVSTKPGEGQMTGGAARGAGGGRPLYVAEGETRPDIVGPPPGGDYGTTSKATLL